MRTTNASRSSGRHDAIPKIAKKCPPTTVSVPLVKLDAVVQGNAFVASDARKTQSSLTTHRSISLRHARDNSRRRREGSETEKRQGCPDHARREAKQKGRAEFRRRARRGDARSRASGGADVRVGGGCPPPRGRAEEVLLGVRVPVVLQLRAVRHAVLQQEVQRRAHRDAMSEVHGVTGSGRGTNLCFCEVF